MGQSSREKKEKREVVADIAEAQKKAAIPVGTDPDTVIGALHGVLDKAVLQVYQERIAPILNDMQAKTEAVLEGYAVAIRRAQAISLTNSRLHLAPKTDTEELTFEKIFALSMLAEKMQETASEEDLQKAVRMFVEGALDDKINAALAEAEETENDEADGSHSETDEDSE